MSHATRIVLGTVAVSLGLGLLLLVGTVAI
jgi:hypothetical protein